MQNKSIFSLVSNFWIPLYVCASEVAHYVNLICACVCVRESVWVCVHKRLGLLLE